MSAAVVKDRGRVDHWADTHSDDLPGMYPDGPHPDRGDTAGTTETASTTGARSRGATSDGSAPGPPPAP